MVAGSDIVTGVCGKGEVKLDRTHNTEARQTLKWRDMEAFNGDMV